MSGYTDLYDFIDGFLVILLRFGTPFEFISGKPYKNEYCADIKETILLVRYVLADKRHLGRKRYNDEGSEELKDNQKVEGHLLWLKMV